MRMCVLRWLSVPYDFLQPGWRQAYLRSIASAGRRYRLPLREKSHRV